MKKYLLILIISLYGTSALSESYKTTSTDGTVLFKATALGLKFEGKGNGAEGTITLNDGVKGELIFNLDTLDTGIGLRNTHMKDNYLETKKFPHSKLVITSVKNFTAQSPNGEYDFEGMLSVRDVQKPISNGKVNITKKDSGYMIDAIFDAKISQFNIPIPKYAGVALKDDIQVVAKATLTDTTAMSKTN
jgi:polyisoprenoid-binding protein YceI